VNGDPPLSDEDIVAQLAACCAHSDHPVPAVTAEQIVRMRAHARDLHEQWRALAPGHALELIFATHPHQ
jgi:hypothetical protein